eukprot:m.276373 g.276373  ORF g.276373 m.276373 type:complete len:329 (+) comp54859_c0_seq7:2571-3557(+)
MRRAEQKRTTTIKSRKLFAKKFVRLELSLVSSGTHRSLALQKPAVFPSSYFQASFLSHVLLSVSWQESMDELLLFSFTNLMHELFQVYRTSLFPFFDTLFGVFMSFLESETAAHKKCALCVFDDVLEFTAHEAERYYVQFAPALLQCLQDEDAEVRQAAAYGCGMIAQTGVPALLEALSGHLMALCQAATFGDASDFFDGNARDNSLAAIGKVLRHVPQIAGERVDELRVFWFSHLPLTFDVEEGKACLEFALDLLATLALTHPLLQDAQLPQLARVLAHAARTTGESLSKVAALLQHFRTSLPAAAIQHMWEHADAETLNTLMSASS